MTSSNSLPDTSINCPLIEHFQQDIDVHARFFFRTSVLYLSEKSG